MVGGGPGVEESMALRLASTKSENLGEEAVVTVSTGKVHTQNYLLLPL